MLRSALLPVLSVSGSLLASVPCAAQQSGDRASPSFDDVPELAGLGDRWRTALESLNVPGFAVVVVKDDRILAIEGFGNRNLSGDPVTPETYFYIASCTKTYTAAAICKLVDEGRVALDDLVEKHVPQFQLSEAEWSERMTIRDLLCHRPGLHCAPIVHRDAYTGEIDDAIYFRLLRDARIAGETQYSNIHFTLAGKVIDAVSGEKWQEYLSQHVCAPAGMRRTTAYASVMYGDKNAAEPLTFIEGGWQVSPLKKTDRTMHAADGMGTTAHDAGVWLILNMNGGAVNGTQVISSGMTSEMLKPQSTLSRPDGRIRVREGFGLGWGTGQYRGQPYRFHGGGYVGAAAYMSFLPEQKIGVAILVNTDGPGQGLTDVVSIDIFDRLLGETGHPDLLPQYVERATQMREQSGPASQPASAATSAGFLSIPASNYTGTFENETWGTLKIDDAADDRLIIVQSGDLTIRCRLTDKDAFTATAAPGMTTPGRFSVVEGTVKSITLRMPGGSDAEFIRKP